MFPAFTNAALLAGLAGVAAPILIHLLLRQRSQKMRFSTVQFFVKKDEQSMRKRKLRNLFLLSLRLLIFLLLVLAFARPYLPNSLVAANTTKRQQMIIVLDTSASMQSVGANGTHWQHAKDAAKQILSKLGGEDRAALVLCSTLCSTASGFVAPPVLAKKLDDIEAGFGMADLSEGLQQALKVLATANPEFETSVQVISDLQRPAIQNIANVILPKELPVQIWDPGDRFEPNIAVADLRPEREGDSPARVVISSYSDENNPALAYHLKIDARDTLSGTIALPGGGATNLPLAIPALKPGWHTAEFSIEAKDGLSLDNTRFASFLVPDPIRALVIESRPSQRAYEEESFFLTAALNPVADGEATPSRFTYEKARIESFASKLQPQAGRPNAQLIVLPAVRQISSSVGNTLRTFVQNGGGLLVFVGDGVSANSYNTELRDLLPAELGRIEPASDAGWRIGKFLTNSPSFSPFRGSAKGSLALNEFTHRFSLKAKPDSVVTAEFNDGVPLVIERKLGEGRIILVNTSADTRWTDWQKHKSFVPWLHATAFYLSGRNPSEQRETAPVFTSGSEVDLAVSLNQAAVKVQRAGGEEFSLRADQDGVVRDVPLSAPGIYSLKNAAGVELRRIAVNVPSSESDLTFGAPAETTQQLVRRTEPEPTTLAAGLFGDLPRGKKLWRLLLLTALLFLIVEPIVANRTAA